MLADLRLRGIIGRLLQALPRELERCAAQALLRARNGCWQVERVNHDDLDGLSNVTHNDLLRKDAAGISPRH